MAGRLHHEQEGSFVTVMVCLDRSLSLCWFVGLSTGDSVVGDGTGSTVQSAQ